MISGATYLVIFDFDYNISDVEKVVFTFKGNEFVTKAYPDDATFSDGKILVPLMQEDTVKMSGYVEIEAQVNFANKSVEKKKFDTIFISSTLATEFVDGNTPSGDVVLANLKFERDGDVLIAKVEGDIKPEEIEAAVTDYLDKHPVKAGISKEECEEIVADYVTEHHDELKGDKGDKGDTGEKGEKGSDGADGRDGVDGRNGVDGNNGADGASAYAIAVSHGYVGTETQWLASLRGKDGENGVDGKTPVKGEDYFTQSDIDEIVSKVESEIGTEFATTATVNSIADDLSVSKAELVVLGWNVPSGITLKNTVKNGVLTQKVGRVDLGALAWTKSSNYFSTHVIGKAFGNNFMASDYTTGKDTSWSTIANKEAKGSSSSDSVVVRDDSYNDASAFKSAMSGKYLYYELSTPIQHNITDLPSVQSMFGEIWDSTKQYRISDGIKYVTHLNTVYELLTDNVGMHPDLHPDFWKKQTVFEIIASITGFP